MLAARVATTVHVPVEDVLRTSSQILQPAEPADITAYEYAPDPEPPDAPRINSVAKTPFVVVNNTADCVVLVIVKLTGANVMA